MRREKFDREVVKFDYHFWAHPESWPRDPPDHVFFARVFQQMGIASFGSKWVQIPFIQEPNEPLDESDDVAWENYERERVTAADEIKNMRSLVAHAIRGQCENKTLRSALRPKSGGRIKALASYVWSTETFSYRFFRCEMSLREPFSADAYATDWLFATRQSLARLLAGQDLVTSIPQPKEQIGTTRSAAPFAQPRAHRRHLTERGLLDLYGQDGPDLGVTEERCYQDINKWLHEHGEPSGVSMATLRRAKRALRSTSSQN